MVLDRDCSPDTLHAHDPSLLRSREVSVEEHVSRCLIEGSKSCDWEVLVVRIGSEELFLSFSDTREDEGLTIISLVCSHTQVYTIRVLVTCIPRIQVIDLIWLREGGAL